VALFTAVGAYLFGHLLQLFLFCTLGNEVIDHVFAQNCSITTFICTLQASKLPQAIFASEWYNLEGVSLKKDMMFVITRAQKDVSFSAMGVRTLDFQTFIGVVTKMEKILNNLFFQVLRLSFSFYTMLSKLTDN
jgi:hypothetical protein